MVLVAVPLTLASPRGDDGASNSFCLTFGDLGEDLPAIDRALSRDPAPGDPDLATLRGLTGIIWGDHVAGNGPDRTDEDAGLVAAAVRAAVASDDPAPIRTPSVLAAATRLGPEAAAACEGEQS